MAVWIKNVPLNFYKIGYKLEDIDTLWFYGAICIAFVWIVLKIADFTVAWLVFLIKSSLWKIGQFPNIFEACDFETEYDSPLIKN